MRNLKKILSLALTAILVFAFTVSLVGCEKTPDTEKTKVYVVTFDTQGGSLVDSQKVEGGKTASKPSAPTKDGFDFAGWYDKKTDGAEYDFSKKIISDLTVYAYWTEKATDDPVVPTEKTYIMEAEQIDLSFVYGGDTSASPSGAGLIATDDNAHGGAFIRALYINELCLEFEFTSDVAVSDAKLTFSFGGEFKDFSFSSDEIQIYVNPELDDEYFPVDRSTRLKYDDVELTGDWKFGEFQITTNMSIKEGTNIVYLLVANTDSLMPTYSTMNAKAPMIDYMKIETTANLTHVTYENQ